MGDMKYAILDTDFVFKINIVCDNDGRPLADRVMAFPEYEFYCHEKLVEELGHHGTREAKHWLQDRIDDGSIRKCSDRDILDMLYRTLGNQCYSRYMTYLKTSCDVYNRNYFKGNYAALMDNPVNREQFVEVLKSCDKAIGSGNHLGEKKAYVLLQALRFVKGDNVYLFCSDDFQARSGLDADGDIRCVSLMAVFMKLRNQKVPQEKAEEYFNSFVMWCNGNGQTQIHVWRSQGRGMVRTTYDLSDVLEGIYQGKFRLMKNGDLLLADS